LKILVTGATGFIGRHLIPELLDRDLEVIASSRSIDMARHFSWFPHVKFVPFEISSEASSDVSCFGKPDILVHLAWEELNDFRSRAHTKVLLPAHLKFLTDMIVAGLQQCVVTGTCLEYGKTEGVLRETVLPRPEIPYAIAKDNLRRSLVRLQRTSPFTLKWIRLFYLYGPGQNPKSLLAQLDRALADGDEVFHMSPGDQLRDYLSVERAAELIAKISLNGHFDGIVNCCSGEPVSVKELVNKRLAELGRDIQLNLGKLPYPDHEAKSFWGDAARLREITERTL
jgi:dTDP-6-deoxy-L-talose 4-dehydrogenase (NAD+)